MRVAPTPAEEALWQRLRGRKVAGLKFRRQHPVDRFILDFYCVEQGLAVEIDGGVHTGREEQDRVRQQFLEERGIRVLRFTNQDVANSIATVLDAIAAAIATSPPL